ncbi:hypothetical protein [Fischerella thermalis]|uniref:hypothetical protein n=2 Tax=Fischerella thermalis TaxID=372787 RepID=UPI000C7FBD85|nr:hypothetical protein [Fischerella thermalis]PLZ07081.1 hypothetical protein CBP17_17760 [Fischerella thermalis WC114]PLZ11366.1 hypothetical protein CBP18_08265 [Fischerella thermalis WC119]PLZ17387.1 hypothetical protein CBP30_19535 [Fischerella thermalis WC157]PLZ23663.1 hypothetical protein CBP29_12210 [Fischerella thermalis WC341]PLZ79166.1 hypothetical protein CBP14_01520 [Fischerella thermalis WC245]
MVNRPPNPAPKPSATNTTKKRIVKKAKKIVKTSQLPTENSQQGGRPVLRRKVKTKKTSSGLASKLAIAILLGSACLVAAFAWVSIELMINPDKVTWLNKLLPAWVKSLTHDENPQTLPQIQSALEQQGTIAGDILPLESGEIETFLLPVFKQAHNCRSDCREIVELRVYQRSQNLELKSKAEKYYTLATQLSITGLEESFVLSPSVDATSENQGSNFVLPVREIGRLEGETSSSSIWLYAQGKHQQESQAIAYGYIFHYNPERTNLQLMLSWTSPSGQLPKWQQVTGGGAKELVVDQTVGLEPQLNIYQVKPSNFVLNPIQLEQISLQTPALNDAAYQDALLIAKSGLWTPAWEWLQFIQKQRRDKIPAAAQAQIDMIRLHSQLTKAQADTTWASPSQQVLADLIDGRWGKALQVFQASPQNAQEIVTLLKADRGRLWNRVETALQVNPRRPEVQAWGALIIAVQQGQERANTFLQGQTQITKESLAYIQTLLAQVISEQ